MLNIEKYKDKILSVKDDCGSFAINKYTDELVVCDGFDCNACYFNDLTNVCSESQNKWLLSEYEEEKEEKVKEEKKILFLNAEKYRDKILKLNNVKQGFAVCKDANKIVPCTTITCTNCIFGSGSSCLINTVNWLLSEYKESIELTKNEYNFLYLLGQGYLARNKAGNLCYFAHKTNNECIEDKSGSFNVGYYFENLKDSFKFIKPDDEEPYSVKDILNNCVIKENE